MADTAPLASSRVYRTSPFLSLSLSSLSRVVLCISGGAGFQSSTMAAVLPVELILAISTLEVIGPEPEGVQTRNHYQYPPGNAAPAGGPSGLGGPEMDPAMPLIDMASLARQNAAAKREADLQETTKNYPDFTRFPLWIVNETMSFNRKPLQKNHTQKNHTSTVHADLKELELHWRLKIGVVRGVSKLYLRYHTSRCIAILMKFTLGATPPPSQQPNTTWYHQCISGTVKCLHSLWSLHRFWHSLSCLGCGGTIGTRPLVLHASFALISLWYQRVVSKQRCKCFSCG